MLYRVEMITVSKVHCDCLSLENTIYVLKQLETIDEWTAEPNSWQLQRLLLNKELKYIDEIRRILASTRLN